MYFVLLLLLNCYTSISIIGGVRTGSSVRNSWNGFLLLQFFQLNSFIDADLFCSANNNGGDCRMSSADECLKHRLVTVQGRQFRMKGH